MGALDGQVAIMTGGGTGIGRAAALMLAAEGAQMVVAGRRKAPIEEVVGEIAQAGGRAVARVCDVEKAAEARTLAEWTIAQYGRVDILVNNAGHSSRARNIRWVGQEEWDSVLAVNLTGVYALTQAVLPSMIERGGGTIITISSLAALRPGLIGGAPYGAAKAAVLNLMGHVHNVLRDKGIRASPKNASGFPNFGLPLARRVHSAQDRPLGRGRGASVIDPAERSAACDPVVTSTRSSGAIATEVTLPPRS